MFWDQDPLLTNEHHSNRERNRRRLLYKKILWYCCVCSIVVLIFLIAMMVGRTLLRKLHHNKLRTSDDNIDDIYTSKTFPNTFSELFALNEKLCRSITSNETSDLNDNVNNIYIIKGEHNLTDEQACGVESILRLFPDKTVYLVDFKKDEQTNYSKCSSNPNSLGLLLYLYKDRLQLVTADRTQYLKNTPLRNFTENENFLFMAMLLTAYKYGGLAVTPDVIVASRDLVGYFSEETVVEPFAIISSHKCDEFLHYLMQSFSHCGNISSHDLECMLTDSVQLFSQSIANTAGIPTARRLNPSEISYDAREPSGPFLRLRRFHGDERWVSDLSRFCKQVVQAYLGIKLNVMEVEEDTSRMKMYILGNEQSKYKDSR